MIDGKFSSITIIGASGRMGSRIVRELAKNGTLRITALTRKSNHRPNIFGVHHVVEIDYNDMDSIVESLRGQEVVICVLSRQAHPLQQRIFIEAALAADVKWFIPNDWGYDFSSLSPDQLHEHGFGAHQEAEKSFLRASGLPFTVVSCGFWYEWSLNLGLDSFGIDVLQKKARLYHDDSAISTSTWTQAAKAVSALLALPVYPADADSDNEHNMLYWKNRNIRVQSFCLKQREILDSVQRVTGSHDADWDISLSAADQVWKVADERRKSGDEHAHVQFIYAKMWSADSLGDMRKLGIHNEILRLSDDESLDSITRDAIDLAGEEFFQKWNARSIRTREA